MYFKNVIIFVLTLIVFCDGSGIFHGNTKIKFSSDIADDYFGFTVLLTPNGLIVGAPKTSATVSSKTITCGYVYNCSLTIHSTVINVTCDWADIIKEGDFFEEGMWFGASIATLPHGQLIVCGPRWTTPYGDKHLLANGICSVDATNTHRLQPLKDKLHQAFMTDGRREEYGKRGTHLNFYAYGQAGMSLKVTEENSVIMGAPGLLQWTGGIIAYKILEGRSFLHLYPQAITNPYFTKVLQPDDYFGYSVESGIFDINGSTLYVAGAPRSKMGYGQVLIFSPSTRETEPLEVQAHVSGPQLGSYFGATLCVLDLDNDGRSDLLVGAPNFVKKGDGLPYDQGAVFVYLTRNKELYGFNLADAGFVSGSGESGARFGTAIAELGDVDGDGFKDVAIGAPFENDGMGVVYIYRGYANGLRPQYIQRIMAENSLGFGISISKGFDVDGNNCNDLAVGAFGTGTAYLFRCIPTILVKASIKVPDAMDLPLNATNFTSVFCVTSPKMNWPHVKLDLKARIVVDPESNRAQITGDSEYNVTISPGNSACDEQTVEVKQTADLSKPISIKFSLEPMEKMNEKSTVFNNHAARLSEESNLESSLDVQITRDCGKDLICTPWLELFLESSSRTYVPGSDTKLFANITVLNKAEPAYDAKVILELPLPPKRIPSPCTLQQLNMTCDLPAPLRRSEHVSWEIELEYPNKGVIDKELKIMAKLDDPLFRKNITDKAIKELVILVTPEAIFSVNGKPLPNKTVTVTREKLNDRSFVSFVHYFEIINYGPSDWSNLTVRILLPEKANLSSPVKGCKDENHTLECAWSVPAMTFKPVILTLRFDLKYTGEYLKQVTATNLTTTILLIEQNLTTNSTTTFILDPAPPVWPVIIGVIAGLLVLSAIIYILYKFGFFSRQKREDLKNLKEEVRVSLEEPSSSGRESKDVPSDESTRELLDEEEESE